MSPKRLDWLSTEVEAWRADGVVTDEQAAAIRVRYVPNTRNALAALATMLGAVFVGVGLLWLVASNVDVDEVSPLARFLVVAALWLGFTAAGAAFERFGSPLRVLAALMFGGTVFQAAQSLQVPAYEPSLLLAWSAGALAMAYALRSVGPLVIGVAAGLGWYLWTLADHVESAPAYVLGLGIATPVLAAVAVAHRGDRMGGPWLRIACLTGLLSVGIASVPEALSDGFAPDRPTYAGIAVAILAVVVAGWRAGGRALPELAGAAGVALACLLLVNFAPALPEEYGVRTGAQLAHSLVASAAFLLAAAGVAAIGVARELPGLVNLAAAALVLFVTLQSFGVFATLLSGAVLFLIVGGLLVVTGLLVDRARRRLHEEIAA